VLETPSSRVDPEAAVSTSIKTALVRVRSIHLWVPPKYEKVCEFYCSIFHYRNRNMDQAGQVLALKLHVDARLAEQSTSPLFALFIATIADARGGTGPEPTVPNSTGP
jgi:hypothetical protein